MKISKSHGSHIDPVKKIMERLKKLNCVDKVAFGFITVVKRKDRGERIKWKEINGGIMLMVVGGTNKQEVYIYTEDIKKVLKELKLK